MKLAKNQAKKSAFRGNVDVSHLFWKRDVIIGPKERSLSKMPAKIWHTDTSSWKQVPERTPAPPPPKESGISAA